MHVTQELLCGFDIPSKQLAKHEGFTLLPILLYTEMTYLSFEIQAIHLSFETQAILSSTPLHLLY